MADLLADVIETDHGGPEEKETIAARCLGHPEGWWKRFRNPSQSNPLNL
jgi:hypothetical protein